MEDLREEWRGSEYGWLIISNGKWPQCFIVVGCLHGVLKQCNH